MLWAIDVGNTHVVVGVKKSDDWAAVWRMTTTVAHTEDELAVTLRGLCDLAGLPFEASGVMVASVVPDANYTLHHVADKWLKAPIEFLNSGEQVGLEVKLPDPGTVGADRIANALAALQIAKPPLVVIDFGTATTFDCVDASGAYVGGSILPGPEVSLNSLASRTAKLPRIELKAPDRAIGSNTVDALRSGITFGYAGAIDAVACRICEELGGEVTTFSTGGLGRAYLDLCRCLGEYRPRLTLDGLSEAWSRIRGHRPSG
ncbi:MAG: type III pantothenate kinase [Fimbriimonadaceae bacterium]